MQWPLCTPCYFGFRPCFCPFRHWCLQDIEATKPMHLASWRERLRCGSYPHAHAASSVFFCTFGEHGSEADEHSADIRRRIDRSEEHTSELQSLMRLSYDVFCFKTKQ